jgi:hypothetical protein
MKKLLLCIVMLYVSLFSPAQSHAYLDPGSGSMVLQLLLGGLAGLAVLLKIFWRKLTGLFGSGRVKSHDSGRGITDR